MIVLDILAWICTGLAAIWGLEMTLAVIWGLGGAEHQARSAQIATAYAALACALFLAGG